MAGTAEVSTSNLRSGASFDNLKATWGKALNIGESANPIRTVRSAGYSLDLEG